MKKIFITGITGFVGHHLTDLLLQKNIKIFGTSLTTEKKKENLEIIKLDLLDKEAVQSSIQKVLPDEIVHLAALTAPGKSYQDPAAYLRNNTEAQLNLLEAVKNLQINPKILIVSSAEIYGVIKEKDLPLDESTPINPTSPYSVSKVTQDALAQMYHNAYGLNIIRARPFNHTGPGQNNDFVVPAFAKQIAEIEKGKEKVLKVGNLTAKRDFTDVRDIVKAYLLLLEKGRTGEVYNVGSGKSYEIQFILDTLLSHSEKEIHVEKDPSRFRPIDVPEIVCNPAKIHKATGWEAKVSMEKTLSDVLDYWREIV